MLVAPSRIGDGKGVYTIGNIPMNAIIMDFIDETMEVLTKDDVCGGTRDTTYMYANHKTNTYINASNNKHSYCGIVNEALEDSKWVYYKARRNITAKEELGTRYSIDGSYWDVSKKYTDKFLEQVRKCYEQDIPFQNNNTNTNSSSNQYTNSKPQYGTSRTKNSSLIDNSNSFSFKDIFHFHSFKR